MRDKVNTSNLMRVNMPGCPACVHLIQGEPAVCGVEYSRGGCLGCRACRVQLKKGGCMASCSLQPIQRAATTARDVLFAALPAPMCILDSLYPLELLCLLGFLCLLIFLAWLCKGCKGCLLGCGGLGVEEAHGQHQRFPCTAEAGQKKSGAGMQQDWDGVNYDVVQRSPVLHSETL